MKVDDFRKYWIKNFPPNELAEYENAVAAQGDPLLEIRNEAYDVNDQFVKGYYSLHYSGKGFLDAFWTTLCKLTPSEKKEEEVKKKRRSSRKKVAAKKTASKKKAAPKKAATKKADPKKAATKKADPKKAATKKADPKKKSSPKRKTTAKPKVSGKRGSLLEF